MSTSTQTPFSFLYSVLLIVCTVTCSFAQVHWPPVTQSTKPWTRWWWQGNAVDQRDLKANMVLYKHAGLGGLEITPIYGVKGYESKFIDYLSPRWMILFDFVLQEARALGLGIDMATGTGWPFGGPWVTEKSASKYFTYKKYILEGGHRLNEAIQYHQDGFVRTANETRLHIGEIKKPITQNANLQAMAIDQIRFDEDLPLYLCMAYDKNDSAIDLTDKIVDRKLDWTAPPGSNWTLYAVFNGLHGKMVERAAPGGEGPVIDHFDADALKQYLSKFDTAFKDKNLSGLRAFFNDSYEVDDAKGQSNWTPLLFEEFKKRRGYDLRYELPALFSTIYDEHNSRVLCDYRETISDLLLEKFTLPWTQWGHAKNKLIRNQSHGSPANLLDLYAAVDIPETEGNDLIRFKFASSAAHVMNKPLASAEVATWLNEHFQSSLADVKNCVDLFFLGGINHIFYHGTNYSPIHEDWPGWLFYAATHFTPSNPMWKDFKTLNDYIARCQSFLQQGKPDNDLLLYFPFADRIQQPGTELLHHFDGMKGFESGVFKSTADSLLAWGYAFDLISDRQIQSLSFKDGLIKSPGGTYQALLISGAEYMPLGTLFKIDSLIRKGAKILFNTMPSKVPGFQLSQKKQFQFDSLLAGLNTKPGMLVEELLNNASIDHEGELYKAGLRCIKRTTNSGQYYFINNPLTHTVANWIPIRSSALSAQVYDPMFKRSGQIPFRPALKGIEVYLSLEAGESIILETTKKTIKSPLYPYFTPIQNLSQSINSGWSLRFIQGGPALPRSIFTDTLRNWLELPIPGIASFSGTASYSAIFSKPKSSYTYYSLDLGRVIESAEIILNGTRVATCIGPAYHVIIPSKLFKSINKLEVLVTNSMANRIIDLEKRKIPWKKFYNINFPARFIENRGDDGLFSAIHWKPRESGLIGPVTLTPLKASR